MKFEHYTASGQRIVLQGKHKDNAHPSGGWVEKMYENYYKHLQREYELRWPKPKGAR